MIELSQHAINDIIFLSLIASIISISFYLGKRHTKESNVEEIIEVVITKLCHDGFICYKETKDGDYDLIKIEDINNGSS